MRWHNFFDVCPSSTHPGVSIFSAPFTDLITEGETFACILFPVPAQLLSLISHLICGSPLLSLKLWLSEHFHKAESISVNFSLSTLIYHSTKDEDAS